MKITWKTWNIRSLFPSKDKSDYKSCVIYKGDCSCGSCYIGETKRNAEVRWSEHNNPTNSSEPSKRLGSNSNHYFTWCVISNAWKNAETGKNLMSKRTLKDWFYLEMVSHRPIDNIMQLPRTKCIFLLLSVLYCF